MDFDDSDNYRSNSPVYDDVNNDNLEAMSESNSTPAQPELEENWDQNSDFDPSDYLTNETDAMEPDDDIYMLYQPPCAFQPPFEHHLGYFDDTAEGDIMVFASTVNNNEAVDPAPPNHLDAGSIPALDWDHVVPQQR